jgi:hypothetical protein
MCRNIRRRMDMMRSDTEESGDEKGRWREKHPWLMVGRNGWIETEIGIRLGDERANEIG